MLNNKCYNLLFLIGFSLILLISEKVFSKKDVSNSNKASQNNSSVSKNKASEKKVKLKPAPLPVHDMGNSWSGVREADGVSTYKLKENPKVIGTFHLKKQDKKLTWKELKSKEFFKDFVQRKEEWLRMINIREWKAERHYTRKRKDFMELNISGSYKRADGKPVFFKEKQIFFSDQVYQILVISQDKKTLRSKDVRRFFKKAQKIGLSKKESPSKEKNEEYGTDKQSKDFSRNVKLAFLEKTKLTNNSNGNFDVCVHGTYIQQEKG